MQSSTGHMLVFFIERMAVCFCISDLVKMSERLACCTFSEALNVYRSQYACYNLK